MLCTPGTLASQSIRGLLEKRTRFLSGSRHLRKCRFLTGNGPVPRRDTRIKRNVGILRFDRAYPLFGFGIHSVRFGFHLLTDRQKFCLKFVSAI